MALAVQELEERVDRLERELGTAPNLATGEAGTGAYRTIANLVQERHDLSLRIATLRGVLAGIGAALPVFAAILAILRAFGH
jgi:hypothetical protein